MFNFAPTCIPEIEVRQVVIEAVAIGLDDSCELAGDVNSDGSTNVLDVVQTVAAILGNGELSDAGAACADSDQQQRAIVNTILALSSGTITAFFSSSFFNTKGQFRPVDIQNATLDPQVSNFITEIETSVYFKQFVYSIG